MGTQELVFHSLVADSGLEWGAKVLGAQIGAIFRHDLLEASEEHVVVGLLPLHQEEVVVAVFRRDGLTPNGNVDVNLAVLGHDKRLLCRHQLLRLERTGVRPLGVWSVRGQASRTCVSPVLLADRVIGGDLA